MESKCVLLRCSRKEAQVDSSYSLNNFHVKVNDTHKDLGVVFSSDLSSVTHINHVASRTY